MKSERYNAKLLIRRWTTHWDPKLMRKIRSTSHFHACKYCEGLGASEYMKHLEGCWRQSSGPPGPALHSSLCGVWHTTSLTVCDVLMCALCLLYTMSLKNSLYECKLTHLLKINVGISVQNSIVIGSMYMCTCSDESGCFVYVWSLCVSVLVHGVVFDILMPACVTGHALLMKRIFSILKIILSFFPPL